MSTTGMACFGTGQCRWQASLSLPAVVFRKTKRATTKEGQAPPEKVGCRKAGKQATPDHAQKRAKGPTSAAERVG